MAGKLTFVIVLITVVVGGASRKLTVCWGVPPELGLDSGGGGAGLDHPMIPNAEDKSLGLQLLTKKKNCVERFSLSLSPFNLFIWLFIYFSFLHYVPPQPGSLLITHQRSEPAFNHGPSLPSAAKSSVQSDGRNRPVSPRQRVTATAAGRVSS